MKAYQSEFLETTGHMPRNSLFGGVLQLFSNLLFGRSAEKELNILYYAENLGYRLNVIHLHVRDKNHVESDNIKVLTAAIDGVFSWSAEG